MSTRPDFSSSATPVPTPGSFKRFKEMLHRLFTILLIAVGILFLLNLDRFMSGHPELPVDGDRLSYALLFIAGLFTGFHCVGMCGALVVGYTVKAAGEGGSKYLTHAYYGAGKTLSYTVIGGLFGALGAIITFTPFMRGMAGLAAGIFLLLFGLATLNLFPSLSRFRIKIPGFVMKRLGKAYRSNSNPFVIGLLNGLMVICGPLQAMYIMAAGTGNPLDGAKMLFVFGLGTLPVMMGFGVLTSALSKQLAPKIVKASGVVVIALGAIMLNRGLDMVGQGYDFDSLVARWTPSALSGASEEAVPPEAQVIRMAVNKNGFEPNEFVLRKGVPVRWSIQGEELSYCNHRIVIPSLGLEFDVQKGENLIEFTPNQTGVIPWSCWMGMNRGAFLVHEETPHIATAAAHPPAALHDHGHNHAAMGHGHDHGHGGPSTPPPEWMKPLLEKSAAAIETLRRSLRP
ncbi:urease accessory protein UreH domain-containing protein [Methylomagnum sp.]